MRILSKSLLVAILVVSAAAADEEALNLAVEQLRHAEGTWDVTTEFLAFDGSVSRTIQGAYSFEFVHPDRVMIGRALQPELDQNSGLLFYYQESSDTVTQVSVGPDGHLWVMSGPADSEVRTTPPTERPNGSTIQLRFTRYNVEPDRFESKMEMTRDGGETWVQRNHQVLTRRVDVEEREPPAEPVDG